MPGQVETFAPSEVRGTSTLLIAALGSFRKLGVPYFGVILGSPYFRKLPLLTPTDFGAHERGFLDFQVIGGLRVPKPPKVGKIMAQYL